MPDKFTPNKFRKVIQLTLLPEIADDIETHLLEVGDPSEWIDHMIADGYRYAAHLDPIREKYSVSLQSYSGATENRGLMIFANAPTLLEAKQVLYIKHFSCCSDGNWESGGTITSSSYS